MISQYRLMRATKVTSTWLAAVAAILVVGYGLSEYFMWAYTTMRAAGYSSWMGCAITVFAPLVAIAAAVMFCLIYWCTDETSNN